MVSNLVATSHERFENRLMALGALPNHEERQFYAAIIRDPQQPFTVRWVRSIIKRQSNTSDVAKRGEVTFFRSILTKYL